MRPAVNRIVVVLLAVTTIVTSKVCLPLDRFPIVESNWFNCPVLSNGTETVNNVYAQCMFVNVPVDWNETTHLTTCTETIQIFAKRYFIRGSENTSHHLWRIPGGGGIPISTLETEAVIIVATLNGLISVYATDKRGVGQSSFLECPTSIVSNFSACLSFIKQHQYRLKHNTFTNTARDLQYVVEVVVGRRQPESKQRVVLMGSSQGTYLLQRYLHLMKVNEPVDAIILDSVLPTDMTGLINFDRELNHMFLDLFTRCALDMQGCAEKFEDSNPMRALYTYKMNEEFQGQTSCLSLLNTSSVEIGEKMSFAFYPPLMQLLPALIYRINRCNSDDKIALRHFLNQTSPPAQDGQPGFSMLVELNNNLAELWSPSSHATSCDYMQGMSANTFAATHVMPDIYCPIQRMGVLGYATDQYYRKYPRVKTQIPILVLHGDMDQALPLPASRHFSKEYSSLNRNLVYIEMPRTGHTATGASPMDNEEVTCGWNLVISFLLSPTFQPDTSCLDKISQIDFAGTTVKSKEMAMIYFGMPNVWD